MTRLTIYPTSIFYCIYFQQLFNTGPATLVTKGSKSCGECFSNRRYFNDNGKLFTAFSTREGCLGSPRSLRLG